MAQISKRPNRPNRPTGTSKATSSPAKKAPSRPSSSSSGRPPAKKAGKSIVNQKQRPWGLIAVAVVLVLFAGGIVAYAVTRHKDSGSGGVSAADAPYVQAEVPAAKAIKGIIWKKHIEHNHVSGTVDYDSSPPMGGNHNQFWANCDGVVYTKQLANENAVHMLEHGAIWITYNPATIKAADLTTLKKDVDGVDFMALTPYAGLKTPISLQAWNYQLFVDSASDPRIDRFIDALRRTPKVTPESASCSDPQFKADQSYPGHPFNG